MAGGLIAYVIPGSLGGRVGLQAGDELVAINDQPLRDVIDVRFYAAEERLTLRVRRGGQERTLQARRRYDEVLGLEFVHPTFDTPIRRCNNHCEFCFVAQMGPGLRRTLYIRDDDYRYSFLFGNYITLTNLTETDWERIAEQHLSPLYVSVHATDPVLRRRILGNPAAPDVMPQLRRLAESNIQVHTQIVLVPGLNGGEQLDRSIEELSALYPAVQSVSVVPVGLTRYHRSGCRVHTLEEMQAVWEQVTGWRERLKGQLGVHFAHLSDEWYLRLGQEVPPATAYDGLDLTENGVGMVRDFLTRHSPLASPPSQSTTLVTGTLFAPLLQEITATLPGVRVVPVVNRFFGPTVTVAGLLTGQDVVAALQSHPLGDLVMLPPAMFGGPEGQTLDEMRPQEIAAALQCRVSTNLSPQV